MPRAVWFFTSLMRIFYWRSIKRTPTLCCMLDEDSSEDMNPDEATDMGSKRFASMSLFDAPVFLPPDPTWAVTMRDEARRQIAAAGDVERLVVGYLELLKRAKALVEFWENNVGPTDDWPVSVMGESEEAEYYLERRVEKLSIAVNFIEDSTCS